MTGNTDKPKAEFLYRCTGCYYENEKDNGRCEVCSRNYHDYYITPPMKREIDEIFNLKEGLENGSISNPTRRSRTSSVRS